MRPMWLALWIMWRRHRVLTVLLVFAAWVGILALLNVAGVVHTTEPVP